MREATAMESLSTATRDNPCLLQLEESPGSNEDPAQPKINTFVSDFVFLNMFYFLAVLSLRCCQWAFSSCTEWGLLSSCGTRASLCVGFSLRSTGSRYASVVMAVGSAVWCVGLVALWHVGSSQTRDWCHVPCIAKWILNHWTTMEALILFKKIK